MPREGGNVSEGCPDCGAALDVFALAEKAATSQLEGGDAWSGGELPSTCPSCGAELFVVVETAVVRRA